MIGRRTLVGLAAFGILAPALTVAAQPPAAKAARIGYLCLRSGPSHLEEAFRQGLHELGYVEGQNLAIEYRWSADEPDRALALAAELIRLNVDVIVSTGGGVPAAAAKKATSTIPIVFTAGDPVRNELVGRLDRPEGNLTGINLLTRELNLKRLELLKDAVPGASRVAVLANPSNPLTPGNLSDLHAAAQAVRVKLQILEVRAPQELERAFSVMVRERASALHVLSDAMYLSERARIVDLAAKNRLPGVFEWREFAEAGGLLSYGTNLAASYRRLATYVDKILKGAKPGDLPIEQPTQFELVINLKTAKSLGLTIPKFVLDRADHVIPP